MDHYRIMIVDDEAEVREGIVAHIDWAALGFTVVAEAENGQDGLEKAENLDLDVVLTDIKMPYVDGLAMGAELIRARPALKLILFSGFDEFEYAKEAIRLNVVEYVLKPVNVEELTRILRRVKALLDEEFAARRNMEALNEAYQKSLPLMRERFLSELLWGAVSPEDLKEQLSRYDIHIDRAPHKIVAVFDVTLRQDQVLPIAREFLPLSVRQVAEERLTGKCLFSAVTGSAAVILITAWEQEDCVEPLMRAVNDACAYCSHIYEVELCAGISRPCRAVRDLHGAYLEAKAALEYRSFVGGGKAIYIQDVEQFSHLPLSGDPVEQRMLSAIKFGSPAQIERMVEDLLSPLGEPGREDWEDRAFMMGVLNTLFAIIRRYALNNQPAIAMRMQGVFALCEPPVSRRSAQARLSELCMCMREYVVEQRESAAKRLVTEAQRFIQENYMNPRLSVDKVCEHLHVSASYFSTVFKQETGQSYVQYLTDARMREAARLLKETDDKTYAIAAQVGYEEPNYFSYVFKKRFGVSPGKYRG